MHTLYLWLGFTIFNDIDKFMGICFLEPFIRVTGRQINTSIICVGQHNHIEGVSKVSDLLQKMQNK